MSDTYLAALKREIAGITPEQLEAYMADALVSDAAMDRLEADLDVQEPERWDGFS